ncbi:MAG TPA: hypothetical protein VNH11_29800 [Pirellulales bacterium]|nr:hypothetical protein [Pirellulales bacterium]
MILAARNVDFPPPNAEGDVRMGLPGGDWSRDELDARAAAGWRCSAFAST